MVRGRGCVTSQTGRDSRYVDDQLLVCVRGELGLVIQPLGPGLLHDGLAGAVDALVERRDLVEVYVLVQRELQRRRDVVRVVVLVAVVVVVTLVLIVAVRHVEVATVFVEIMKFYRMRAWFLRWAGCHLHVGGPSRMRFIWPVTIACGPCHHDITYERIATMQNHNRVDRDTDSFMLQLLLLYSTRKQWLMAADEQNMRIRGTRTSICDGV